MLQQRQDADTTLSAAWLNRLGLRLSSWFVTVRRPVVIVSTFGQFPSQSLTHTPYQPMPASQPAYTVHTFCVASSRLLPTPYICKLSSCLASSLFSCIPVDPSPAADTTAHAHAHAHAQNSRLKAQAPHHTHPTPHPCLTMIESRPTTLGLPNAGQQNKALKDRHFVQY